ncbi:MAG: alpha/beta fold hydrolase [Candidatus Brocadiae bacterium]|nr:alpha/beta fold hydrolase [Candidatus Brocadiia bacterium]
MEIQVSFTSQGANVFGVLHLPEETPAPGLIMCHGFTGHKAEAHRLFVEAARDFCDHGLAVLRFDFRGSGDSEGDFADMTVSGEIADAAAALEFLASRPEVDGDRLGVLGLSIGGCVSACLAGREPAVRALVLWAAVAHLERLTERLAPELGGGKVLDMQGWAVGRALLDDVSHIEPLREVARYAGPSLVVHGSQDDTVPPSDAADYRVALGGHCRLHYVEGADHVFSGLAWKREAIEASRAFLVKALGARA